MTPKLYLLAIGVVVIAACNGLTGVDKYDLSDCDGGSCTDSGDVGDRSSAADSGADVGSSDGGADSPVADVGVDTAPTCDSTTQGPVTLTVSCKTGTNATVSSDQPNIGFVVACGEQKSACFPTGQVRLKGDNQAKGTWSGACNGSDTDTCQFTNPTTGSVVSVTNLQPN